MSMTMTNVLMMWTCAVLVVSSQCLPTSWLKDPRVTQPEDRCAFFLVCVVALALGRDTFHDSDVIATLSLSPSALGRREEEVEEKAEEAAAARAAAR
jgi:hypothetical protein